MLPSDSKRKRKEIVRASSPLHAESSKPGNMILLKTTFVVCVNR
jgi:hypothetical protein